MAHDKHDNPSNITFENVRAAAEANDMGVAESLVMILETAEEDRRQHQEEYETGEHSILRAGQGRP